MPLNLGGGSFAPHIRWMAEPMEWVLVNDGVHQVCNWTECIIDFANIKTGWSIFAANMTPEWVWDLSINELAPAPSDGREWKRGLAVNMFSPQQFGGNGLREFSANGIAATRGIGVAYDLYEAQSGMNPGLLPVVQFSGGRELITKFKNKQFFEPILTIARWVPRPPALDAALAEVAQPVTQATTTVAPVAPVAGQVSQPAAPQPAPAAQVGPAAVPVAPPPQAATVAAPAAPAAAPAPVPSTTPEF